MRKVIGQLEMELSRLIEIKIGKNFLNLNYSNV